ncbi:hypothetical protein F4802DRAFT_446180 [Xylaria palmicola]|nr:hypothetical protein F4802DRAFT_446180 [Xylaria palmicola]
MELCFIADTGRGSLKETDRRAIRSHVMKGKNLGRWRSLGSRPRQRQLKQLGDRRENAWPPSDPSTSNPNSRISYFSSRSSADVAISPGILVPLAVPRKLGSGASTMSLADSVPPGIFDIVLRFSSIAKQLLFSLETCIFFDRRAENWVAPLAVDAAFLHANISNSLYYCDVVLARTTPRASQRAWHYHHTKTLSLLRDRLDSDDGAMQLSNSTVAVILTLAGQAFCTGDLKTAMKHMEGIRRIVGLRGGFGTFKGNEKLVTEILRCDLGMMLHSGTKSLLLTPPLDDAWPYPPLSLFLNEHKTSPNADNHNSMDLRGLAGIPIDGQLSSVWNTMSEFCAVINLAAVTKRCITVDVFLTSMASVMYRLVDMQFEHLSATSEVIRLGLLCFCCSVFLPWRRLGVSLPHLASSVKRAFLGLNGTGLPASQQRLTLWLLMAGSVSVLGDEDEDEDWLRPLLRRAACSLELGSWDQARRSLSSLMWIDIVHDKAGKRVFEAALS